MPTTSSPRSTAAWWFSNPRLLLLALCGVYVAHSVALECVAEDAHITFRFARNVAAGHGFVWNAGEAPIEGFTTLLWVLIAAAGYKLGINVFLLSQVVGVTSALCSLVLTYAFAREFLRVPPWAALLPCAFLAFSGPFAAWGTSGMEMTAFGACIMFGTYAWLKHVTQDAPRWLAASGLALGVASVLRPEGAMVFVTLAGFSVLFLWRSVRSSLQSYLVWVAIFGLHVAGLLTWRLIEFGDIVPNTFHQKTGGGFWQHARGAAYLINFFFFFGAQLLVYPVLVAWEKGIGEPRRLLRLGNWFAWFGQNAGLGTCIVLCAAYCVYNVYVGGDYMAMYRFLVPVLPFFYLLLAPLVGALTSALREAPHKSLVLGAVVMGTVWTGFVHSTPLEKSFYRQATWQHGNYRGIETERRYVGLFTTIGKFFEEYSSQPNESLATRSIGAIGYYAESLAIHDLSGLTDRHIARVVAKATNQGWAGHEKWDLDYSFKRLPTYFLLDENLHPDPLPSNANENAAIMAAVIVQQHPHAERYAEWITNHPEFIEQHYELKSVWMTDEFNDESGHLAFLQRRTADSN